MIRIRQSENYKSRGFSLVEVMVGLVIGMLGILVIMQVFAVSEGRKRTTTSGSDAQINGLSALLAIERDVRQAGYGYTSAPGAGTNPALGCNTLAYNSAAVPTSIPFKLTPVVITDGGPGVPDSITIIYGSGPNLATPVGFTQPSPAAANYQLINNADKAGFAAGDLVLAMQPGQPCTLAQVTTITGPGSDNLIHAPSSPYNPSGGFGVSYGLPTAQLLNLGNPIITQYFVLASNLAATDLKLGAPGVAAGTTILADNIVTIQAQYGIDPTGVGLITAWVEPTGAIWGNTATTPAIANILQIKAIRIAVVARSGLMERGAVTFTCANNAGTNYGPCAWQDTVAWPAPLIDLRGDPAWANYRYKVYQTIIPIRNMIWSES